MTSVPERIVDLRSDLLTPPKPEIIGAKERAHDRAAGSAIDVATCREITHRTNGTSP